MNVSARQLMTPNKAITEGKVLSFDMSQCAALPSSETSSSSLVFLSSMSF